MKRFVCLSMAALLLFALSGCKNYSYVPTEQIFTPGVYVAEVQGHNGPIKVSTTFDRSRVTKIEVLSHEESLSIGDTAMQTIADAIIEKQGFDVDVVSGATYSSAALLEAVSSSAKAAGADVEIITLASLVPPAAPSTGESNFPEPPYNPGVYTASSLGFGGDVQVSVEVDTEKVLSITATGTSETPGIGMRAIDELPPAILSANSTEIDGISGATMTSNAIKAAVMDALGQAK